MSVVNNIKKSLNLKFKIHPTDASVGLVKLFICMYFVSCIDVNEIEQNFVIDDAEINITYTTNIFGNYNNIKHVEFKTDNEELKKIKYDVIDKIINTKKIIKNEGKIKSFMDKPFLTETFENIKEDLKRARDIINKH